MTGESTIRTILIALALGVTAPAIAQERGARAGQDPQDLSAGTGQDLAEQQPTPLETSRTGQTANSSVGEVGQRQSREQVAPNTQPMARIARRISNRVQNRIRNRIDRNYDPQANAASPFAVAEDRTRTSSRRPR